ncbi:MAG: PilZ domain-containing protein [Pseudomonadales bacterium]
MAETARDDAVSRQSRFLTDPNEISQVFKLLRDHRAELQLRFDKETTTYRAKVLDLQGPSVLIEDIHPRDGMQLLRSGRAFALAARVDGLYIHSANNHAHKSDSERNLPFFHVALPASMLFQQRRRAARFRLPLRVVANGAQITLRPGNKEAKPLQGTIIDISAGGCRAEFAGFKFRPIHDEDPLEGCSLSIPNLLELNSRAALRHSSLDSRRNVFTCGIEFTEMSITDRRRLEQFIQIVAKIPQSG